MGIKVKQRLSILTVIVCLTPLTALLADEEEFTVSLTVTQAPDVTAPSTPLNLSTSPVATSQINLTWDMSTDDVGVVGYKVFRDNLFIATSTGTSYSDTGLQPSALYTYTVSAFDAAFNESARSASSSATTLAAIPQSLSVGGTSGQFIRPLIENVQVSTQDQSVEVRWQTIPFTQSVLEIRDYTGDVVSRIADPVFKAEHRIESMGLRKATDYRGTIIALDTHGRSAFYNFEFSTATFSEGVPNANQFISRATEEGVYLSWRVPVYDQFKRVRIVRSENFFPVDPNDGLIVYEGVGQSFVDEEVADGTTYFYALFVEDVREGFSSGALSSVRVPVQGEPIDLLEDPFVTIPDAPFTHPVIEKLTFPDFDFIQDGIRINSFFSDSIAIDGTKNLTVSLDYEKVPEVLKTISVTLYHPYDESQVFSFLLRVNEERTAYQATIGPLGTSGIYRVGVVIVDYNNQGLKKIEGSLIANVFESRTEGGVVDEWVIRIIEEKMMWILGILLFMLGFVVRGFLKKKTRSNESPS